MKRCLDCNCDISSRGNRACRCLSCQKTHRHKYKRQLDNGYNKKKRLSSDYRKWEAQQNRERYHKNPMIAVRRFARIRGLGSIQLCANIIDEPVSWHHVTDAFILACPRDIHKLYEQGYGRDWTTEKHRFMVNSVCKQIYGMVFT